MKGTDLKKKRNQNKDEEELGEFIGGGSKKHNKVADESQKRRLDFVEKIETQNGSSKKKGKLTDLSTKDRVLTFFKIKSTPFKSKSIDIYRNPFYVKQHRQMPLLKRFYYNQLKVHPYSYILAFLLVLIAVIFGSINILSYFSIDTDVCENTDTQLIYYLEYFKNYTNYSEAIELNDKTQSIFLQYYVEANISYGKQSFSDIGIANMSWPQPYRLRYVFGVWVVYTSSYDLLQNPLGVSQKRRRRGKGGKNIANFVRHRFWLAPYLLHVCVP